MKHEKLTEEVIVYILTRNIEELSELTRYTIAQKFQVNENYLSKRFKKDAKISLFDYIEASQIRYAAELLKENHGMKVTDIHKKVGIEKYQNFAKKFKKIFGISPCQYRDIFQKEISN